MLQGVESAVASQEVALIADQSPRERGGASSPPSQVAASRGRQQRGCCRSGGGPSSDFSLVVFLLVIGMPRLLESVSDDRGHVYRGGIGILRAADEASGSRSGGDGGREGRESRLRWGARSETGGLSKLLPQRERGGRFKHLDHTLALRGGAMEEAEADRFMSMMHIYDMMGMQRPDDEDFNSGIPPREEGDAQGAAAHKWRFTAGGWAGHDLLMQHRDWNTSIAIFAWTLDGVFRFQCHRQDTAKWFFKDASVIDCLWMPPENFTGVNWTFTQEQNDVYMIQQLLQDMDDGRGKRIRDHGIDFGMHWRFRALGDYILGTHGEVSIELWLTETGFVALGKDDVDRGVIVKAGEIQDVRRAQAEAEIPDIEERRRELLADTMGFEAEFYGEHRDMMTERLRQTRRDAGCCSSDESFSKDTTSDPDWDAPGPVGDGPMPDPPNMSQIEYDSDGEIIYYPNGFERTLAEYDDPEMDWYGDVALKYKDVLEAGYSQVGDGDGLAVLEVDHQKKYNASDMRKRAEEIVAKYAYLDEGEHTGPRGLHGSWGGTMPPTRRQP